MSNIRTYRANQTMHMISVPLHSTTNNYHLDNNREVVDAKGRILQRTNYYAFGLTSEESSSSIQPYKYNGKEFDNMHGLNTYDYGARQYNPVTARWDRMDPHGESYYPHSPFAYCGNNPVMLVDPDGMDWILCTGDKVYWYGGELGDTSDEIMVYNATSGYKDEDQNIDFQSAGYQSFENMGPTPEGIYHINLKPDSSRHAKIYQKSNGSMDYIKSRDGGIEQLSYDAVDEQGQMMHYYSPSWGNQRAALTPDKVTGATNSQRKNDSYYFHDSQKGYTHGCVEVESGLFNMLVLYREAGNNSISVQIQYPDSKHKTNGGTKR